MSYRSLLFAAALTMGTLSVTPAGAKESADLDALKAQLDSPKQEQVLQALESIQKSKDPAAAPLLDAVLGRGGSVAVLKAALKAAGKLKQPSSTHAVGLYVGHRTPAVRQAAFKALLKTGGSEAVDLLVAALRSNDARIRGIAATGLGSLGAAGAFDDLMAAFDHGLAEAASAIGQICRPEDCEEFASRVGSAHFDVMTGGFDQILFRPTKEMPDAQKLRIIGRLRELGTTEAGIFLGDVLERWPAGWSPKIKESLRLATKASGGS